MVQAYTPTALHVALKIQTERFNMKLSEYNFEPSTVDGIDPKLLEEAKKRGFYHSLCRWDDYFHRLILNGGSIKHPKGLCPEYKQRAVEYLKRTMRNNSIEYGDRSAVCAMILSEISIHPNDLEKQA